MPGRRGRFTRRRFSLPAAFVALIGLCLMLVLARGGSSAVRAQSGGTVTYAAGWDLVGAPTATLLDEAQGPAYALGPDASSYQALGPGEEIAGRGAWVFFPQDTTVSLGPTAAEFSRTLAPAGQYVLIGNPSSTQTLAISGADQVFSYDPVNGYAQVTELAPGRGAFALAAAAGEITLGKAPSGTTADDIRAIQGQLSTDPTPRAPFDRLAAAAEELLRNRDYASLQTTLDDITAATEDGLRAKGSDPLPPLDAVQRNAFATIREQLSTARAAAQAGQVAQADSDIDAARRAAQAAQDDAVMLARISSGSGARYLDFTPQALARYGALIRGSLPAIVLGIPHGDDFWSFAQALLNGQSLPAFGPTATPTPSPTPTPTPASVPTPAPVISAPAIDPPSGRPGTPAFFLLPTGSCRSVGGLSRPPAVSPEVRNSAGQLQDVDVTVGEPQPGADAVRFAFTYPNLPPGTYTLAVFVYDLSGGTPNQICTGSASFTVTP